MFLENVNLFWLGERVGIVGDRICLVVIDFDWFFLYERLRFFIVGLVVFCVLIVILEYLLNLYVLLLCGELVDLFVFVYLEMLYDVLLNDDVFGLLFFWRIGWDSFFVIVVSVWMFVNFVFELWWLLWLWWILFKCLLNDDCLCMCVVVCGDKWLLMWIVFICLLYCFIMFCFVWIIWFLLFGEFDL